MINFEPPLLIPLIFMFFTVSIGFGFGAMYGEISKMRAEDDESYQELRWFLLIVPSLIGVCLILWWPTAQLGGG